MRASIKEAILTASLLLAGAGAVKAVDNPRPMGDPNSADFPGLVLDGIPSANDIFLTPFVGNTDPVPAGSSGTVFDATNHQLIGGPDRKLPSPEAQTFHLVKLPWITLQPQEQAAFMTIKASLPSLQSETEYAISFGFQVPPTFLTEGSPLFEALHHDSPQNLQIPDLSGRTITVPDVQSLQDLFDELVHQNGEDSVAITFPTREITDPVQREHGGAGDQPAVEAYPVLTLAKNYDLPVIIDGTPDVIHLTAGTVFADPVEGILLYGETPANGVGIPGAFPLSAEQAQFLADRGFAGLQEGDLILYVAQGNRILFLPTEEGAVGFQDPTPPPEVTVPANTRVRNPADPETSLGSFGNQGVWGLVRDINFYDPTLWDELARQGKSIQWNDANRLWYVTLPDLSAVRGQPNQNFNIVMSQTTDGTLTYGLVWQGEGVLEDSGPLPTPLPTATAGIQPSPQPEAPTAGPGNGTTGPGGTEGNGTGNGTVPPGGGTQENGTNLEQPAVACGTEFFPPLGPIDSDIGLHWVRETIPASVYEPIRADHVQRMQGVPFGIYGGVRDFTATGTDGTVARLIQIPMSGIFRGIYAVSHLVSGSPTNEYVYTIQIPRDPSATYYDLTNSDFFYFYVSDTRGGNIATGVSLVSVENGQPVNLLRLTHSPYDVVQQLLTIPTDSLFQVMFQLSNAFRTIIGDQRSNAFITSVISSYQNGTCFPVSAPVPMNTLEPDTIFLPR